MPDRKIQIVLTAVDRTKQAFASATGSLQRFQTRFVAVARGLGSVFGVGAGGAVAGVAALVNEMDKAAKAAGKLGTTTEELSRLGFAAEQTGVNARTLEIALQRMVRKIGDARGGSAEAAKAFERLNLNVNDLANLTVEQQFIAIADAVSGLDNNTDQLSATVKIFDSEAAGIVNTLRLGGDAISAFGDELEELGGVINGSTAAAAERLNDNLARLGANAKGVSLTVANSLVPGFAAFSELLASGSIDRALETLRDDASILPKELNLINAEIVGIKEQIDAINESGGISPALQIDLSNLTENLEALERRRNEIFDAFARQRAAQRSSAAKNEQNIEEQLTAFIDTELGKRQKSFKDYVKDLEDVISDQEDLLKRLEKAGRSVKDGIEAVQIGETLDAGDLFARVHEAIAQLAGGDTEQARQTIENIAEAMDVLNERGDLTILAAQNIRDRLKLLVRDLGEAQKQDIVDAARAQEQAAEAQQAIETNIKPKIRLELAEESIQEIQRAALAAMEGFSVPVNIVAGTLSAGNGQAGVPVTQATGVGAYGEPVFSDQSAASGHRVP